MQIGKHSHTNKLQFMHAIKNRLEINIKTTLKNMQEYLHTLKDTATLQSVE
jgi:hypothetical protein